MSLELFFKLRIKRGIRPQNQKDLKKQSIRITLLHKYKSTLIYSSGLLYADTTYYKSYNRSCTKSDIPN